MSRSLRRMFAFALSFLILAGFSGVTFCAQAKFSLSDTEINEGRIFEVQLSAKDFEDVTAFLCELSFDGDAMEYRGYSLGAEDAVLQVNSSEKGKIKAVFLCEEEICCTEETALVTFRFKAIKAGDYEITPTVSQLINSASEDMEALCTQGCVRIEKKALAVDKNKGDKNNSDETADTTEVITQKETTPDEAETGYTQIKSENTKAKITFIVLMIIALIIICGFVLYKPISKKLSDNNDKRKKK